MKILKWLGLVIVVLAIAAFGTVSYFKSAATARLAKTWAIEPADVPIPWPLSEEEIAALRAEKKAALAQKPSEELGGIDPETMDVLAGVDLGAIARERAVQRGQRLMYTRFACFECHGTDFAGKVILDDPMLIRWVAPNITKGGVTKDWTGKDWVRILRHGVMRDGTTSSMPAVDYTWQSDREISDVAAYISAMPAVTRPTDATTLGPIFSMLIANGTIPLSAETIDHKAPRPKLPPDETKVSVELGKHIANVCVGCHGADLSGGKQPGTDPNWPPTANLTQAGVGSYTKDEFFASMREGKSKDGRAVSPVMPWQLMKDMTDVELESLWTYLKSLPPVPTKA